MRVLAWSLGCLLAASALHAQVAQPDAPLSLTAALDRARTFSPAIAAIRARRAVGTAGLTVAGERLNPEARVEFNRDTPRQAYTLALPWETGGKRGRRLAVATASVQTTDAEIAQVVADTRNAVRGAFFDLVAATARAAVLDELLGLATRVRDTAQQRFDAGGVPRLEVLQAELALTQSQNETAGVRGRIIAARTQLNALVGLPLETLTTTIDSDLSVVPSIDSAVSRARASSVELSVIDRRIDEQRARIALARALQRPDLTPEATITHGFGAGAEFQTGWKAAFAVSLPVFTSHRAGVALEGAVLSQLMAERDAAASRITGDVVAAIALASAQRDQYLRYRDEIIPQALEVERLADDAYRLGQTGITAYLQALQATRDVRLRALQTQADLQSALTALDRAIAAPVQP